jgi:hypothetical protein
LRFEYGNIVNHEDLFSGEYTDLPGYTHDRRWMISEYIFNEKVNRLPDYRPTRTIYPVKGDSGAFRMKPHDFFLRASNLA